MLVIGFAAGDIPKIPLNLLLLKSCSLVGVFWGASVQREPAVNAANMAPDRVLGRRGQTEAARAQGVSAGANGRRHPRTRPPRIDRQGHHQDLNVEFGGLSPLNCPGIG